MDSALLIHRLHFAFTITFHYLFPQLTMGLAPLIVVLKSLALRRHDEIYNQAARFWARIFGINFVLGVVTGIPMEFQFGTNWSHFSRFAGGVIGQTLAMEGMFAFFLESAFLGLFLYGEKRLSSSRPLVVGGCGISRVMAVRLFHYRDRCLDAIPRRLRACRRWINSTRQFLEAGTQSLGRMAVCAQHERRRHHRRVCDGLHRSVLLAMGQVRGVRTHIRKSGRGGRLLVQRLTGVPDRRPARANGRFVISRRPWRPWKVSSPSKREHRLFSSASPTWMKEKSTIQSSFRGRWVS